MDRRKLLCVGVAVGMLIVPISTSIAFAETGCSTLTSAFGSCTGAQTNSSSVDVWGTRTTTGEATPANSGSGSSGAGATNTGWITPADEPFSLYPRRPQFNNFCDVAAVLGNNTCTYDPASPTPIPAKPAPTVTISDLANFVPERPSLSMQPNGWTVLGVETNLVTGTSQHVVSGRLFGAQAEVRFTPQDFDWNYGDGTTNTTSSAGSNWAALGVKEFARTATSHRYLSLGNFSPTVTVRFGAEYRIGGGEWVPVRGQVSAPAASSTVIVQSADTVLMTGACTPNRPAPGC